MGICCCLLFLLLGCATTKDVKILDEEIGKLQQQVTQLRKEKEALKEELSQQTVENQKLKSDLLLRLESLQSDVRTLSVGVEEYKEFLKRPTKEIDRMREDLEFRLKLLDDKSKTNEERLKELEVRLKGLETKEPKVSESTPKPIETETPGEWKGISPGAGDLYKDAYETLQKGNIEGARRKFEAFLKQYPNTELSDNAQFWIGETYYLKKDFEKAILEYEKAIAKYPEGDKIPSALFKQALAFLELGDKTNARNLLKRVVEKYPNTDQAEMAKKKLGTIK
jgi:tol-pal system protein YbgF